MRTVHATTAVIEALRDSTAGLGRPVPGHVTVLVPFDQRRLARDAVLALIRDAVASAVAFAVGDGPATPSGAPDLAVADAPIEIAVRYGGDGRPGPRGRGRERAACGPRDVVRLHAAASYRVLFLGFAPGFAYLGGLPEPLVTPRRATPRERVPAGSVAIAGGQTAVYPLAMPGGWNLIGRTDAVLFDPAASATSALRPGTTVRFVPVR